MFRNFSIAAGILAFASQAFGFQVEPALDPNPPKMGKQSVTLTVKNDAGKPAEKATVTAELMMPAMPGMPEMKSKGKVESKGKGVHALKFNLSMDGTWYLVVTVKEGGKEEQAFFEITTGKQGSRPIPGIPTGGAGMEGHHHH